MAVLKMGSKGKEVKDLQANLNKVGAKPKLTADGMFGPGTDKAVRTYQKKNGLKVDGAVGENTLAAIKFGGKLPEMTVTDYTTEKTHFQKVANFNRQNTTKLVKTAEDIEKLSNTMCKEILIAKKFNEENRKHWIENLKNTDLIISKQAAFESERAKNPKKAEKLAKECEKLHKYVRTFGKAKIQPNYDKSQVCIKKANKIIDSIHKIIESVNS